MAFAEQHTRRQAAGVSLIAGPGLMLAGWSIFPSVESDNSVWVGQIADGSSRAAVGAILVIAGMAVSVLAFMTLVHLLRERQPLLGDLGGALAIVGIALMGALMGALLAQIETIQYLGESTETVALIDDSYNGTLVLLGVGPVLATVGLVVLAVGLARAHSVPPLLAALLGLGTLVQFAGLFAFGNMALVIGGFAAMFLALGAMGVQLLTAPDREWQHTPVFHGFHRVTPT